MSKVVRLNPHPVPAGLREMGLRRVRDNRNGCELDAPIGRFMMAFGEDLMQEFLPESPCPVFFNAPEIPSAD